MKIKNLKRSTVHHYGPVERCQCFLENRCEIESQLRRGMVYNRHQPKRCTRDSVFEIDGITLCAQHAGKLALNHLIQCQWGAKDEQN